MTLSGLFILRVAAGASAVDAHASEWLILCTGMIALFLGFTKRRQEAVSELHSGDQAPARCSSTTRSPSSTRWSRWSPPATVISYAIYAVNSPLIGSEDAARPSRRSSTGSSATST